MNLTQITEKECSICGIIKPITEFYKQQRKKKDGTMWIYYNPECKQCTKKRSHKWIGNNRKRYMQKKKEWKQNNREHYLNYLSEYHKENRKEESLYMSEWQKNNKDKIKGYQDYRNMNKNHKISNEEWENCKNYFNYRCAYCSLPIEEHYIKYKGKIQLGDFHREHVNHNGLNDISNCIPACKACNTSKHDRNLEDWYNESNPNFTQEKLDKIYKWLEEDYKKYIV